MDGMEFLREYAWEIDFQEKFSEALEQRKEKYLEKTDREILCIAIKCGPELNQVTEHFPAYDVALKILYNNWTPTEKQRKAIINVTAFFKTKRKFEKEYPGAFL